jgi:hypothetical protein
MKKVVKVAESTEICYSDQEIDIIQMKHFEGFGSIGIPVCASIDAVF